MREGWALTKLGNVTRQHVDKFKVEPGCVYRNLGVKWYAEGVFAREPKLGSEMKATSLYRVREGQFIYNRMFATEGSFALVTAEFADGVVSNEFPVFDVDSSRALPEFLQLHFQQPAVWADVAAECVGTTKSRSRWKEQRFADYELALPPLKEQLRIVDLIGSLDDAISAADTSAEAARQATSELRADHFEGTRGDWESIEALADVIIGKQKNVKGDARPPVPYLRAANLSGGRLDLTDMSTMPFTATERLRMGVAAGDVLVVEGGGGYGHSAMWPGTEHPFVGIQNSVLRLRAHEDKAIPEYLLQWSKWAKESGYFDDSMTSTTIPHLSLARVKAMTVPAVSVADQRRIVSAMDAAAALADSTEDFAAALRATRAELLTVLLSGNHAIPESYRVELQA